MSGYLLVWSSGHVPPRPVYFQLRPVHDGITYAHGATYERTEATVFDSEAKALKAYRAIHSFPEDYEKYIANGETRVETVDQPTLVLNGVSS